MCGFRRPNGERSERCQGDLTVHRWVRGVTWGMVKIRVLLLATSCAVFATSQVTAQGLRTVRGTVLAARDSTPISGVSIRVIEFNILAQSDQAGRFQLIHVPRSPARVTFDRLYVISYTVPLSAFTACLIVYL